jgi:hypothetical protein
VVKITVGWGSEFQGAEADVVKGLVIKTEALIGVLNQLVEGEDGVVRLDDGIGDLRGGEDGEGAHHAVGILLADLGNEESSHTGTGTATEGVSKLEALKTVARLGLLADDIQDGVDKLGTFSVVALGPVVTGTRLSEDEVVGAEDLAKRTSADGVHGSRLEIHQDGAGHVTATGRLVEVDVDALELEVGVALVGTGGVNTVLVGDYLPELGTDLVTTLTTLDMLRSP